MRLPVTSSLYLSRTFCDIPKVVMAEQTEGEQPQIAAAEELKAQLDQLKAAATQQYSLKNYSAAAEIYSEAARIQDLINGEMSPPNAELLYQYGRCLYHVAVSRSDVLGGKVVGEEQPKRKKRKTEADSSAASLAATESNIGLIGNALKSGEQKLAEDIVEAAAEEKESGTMNGASDTSKPYFQITGDENFTDSEDEDAEDEDAEEEEDDFATAYEILDMARVLTSKQIEILKQSAGKDTAEIPGLRQLKERLADTFDLQAEISLENERFHDAINDARDGLMLKLELYPEENSLVAEAHFKLSLALEFASVTSTAEGEGENPEAKAAQIDENLRKEAALEMEKAIASSKLRIWKEEASLPSLDKAKAEETKKKISEVKEIVADMEQRLVELRNPAVTSLSALTGAVGGSDGSDVLRGVLGTMLGESQVEKEKRIKAATAQANDLSSLVKHRRKGKEEVSGTDAIKRKSEEVEDGGGIKKKAKVEEANTA